MSKAVTAICFAEGESALGPILVATTLAGICYIALDNNRGQMFHALKNGFPNATLTYGGERIKRELAPVINFIASPHPGFNQALDARGTPFQLYVWALLRKIPMGQTASYTQIANAMNSPQSVRAVAGACAANTIALSIPCHRIVCKNGQISGYRWGVERKVDLLEREQAALQGHH